MHRAIILFLFLTGCQEKQVITHFYGIAMEMPYHIQVGSSLSKRQELKVMSIIQSSFLFVDNTFNHRNPNSELSLLNSQKANEPFKLSPDLEHLLLLTDQVVKMTEGRFDPTYGTVIKHWKKALIDGQMPFIQKQKLGWNQVIIESHTLTKLSGDIFFDLDGIAKGMSIDHLVLELQNGGFPNVYVEWAGEIKVSGKHPHGRCWNAQLPQKNLLLLQNEALASSGNQLQQKTLENNTTYTHIINPKTRLALEVNGHSISNVTVKAPSCAIADGLATGGMLFSSIDAAEKWAKKIHDNYPGIQIFFSCSNNP